MPTYIYETIPLNAADQPEQFEIEQRMSAAALTTHPDTGVPVRRVVTGGAGFLSDRPLGGVTAAGSGHVHGPGCHH